MAECGEPEERARSCQAVIPKHSGCELSLGGDLGQEAVLPERALGFQQMHGQASPGLAGGERATAGAGTSMWKRVKPEEMRWHGWWTDQGLPLAPEEDAVPVPGLITLLIRDLPTPYIPNKPPHPRPPSAGPSALPLAVTLV